MSMKRITRTACSVLVAVTLSVTLCACGNGARKQETPQTGKTAQATSPPSPSPSTPFGQVVVLYRETGTLSYTKPGEYGAGLICDDKLVSAHALAVPSGKSSDPDPISINGTLVKTRSYMSKDDSGDSGQKVDIIYPRTITVKAVIVNGDTMGVVRVPKDGEYLADIRLVLDVQAFASSQYGGSITSLVACVAKPQPKKKKTGKK